MKAFKKFSTAKQANSGSDAPILKAGNLWLVFETSDGTPELAEFAVLRDGTYSGNVSVKHLERLGNANWAEKGNAT